MAKRDKYFWFKCNHDFFENHKMRCIERSLDFDPKKLEAYEIRNVFSLAMGYVYIKMLAESCTHNGELRLSDTKAYTNRTLAKVIGCPLPFFNYIMESLKEFDLLTVEDDGTITLPDIKKLLGNESESAERMRRLREKRENTSKTPQEASAGVEMSNDTPLAPNAPEPVSERPANERKKSCSQHSHFNKDNPPTIELVKSAMKSGLSSQIIPDWFITNWYNLMCGCGWMNKDGTEDFAAIWSKKLAYAWSDHTINEHKESATKERARAEEESKRQEQEKREFEWNRMILTSECDD